MMESVNNTIHQAGMAAAGQDNSNTIDLDNIDEVDTAEDSAFQSSQQPKEAHSGQKKRKKVDPMQNMCDLLSELRRDTNSRLDDLVSGVRYQADLGMARKEVFDLVGDVPGLSTKKKFEVCDILADKVERLEVFMGLPASARPEYVFHLLQ